MSGKVNQGPPPPKFRLIALASGALPPEAERLASASMTYTSATEELLAALSHVQCDGVLLLPPFDWDRPNLVDEIRQLDDACTVIVAGVAASLEVNGRHLAGAADGFVDLAWPECFIEESIEAAIQRVQSGRHMVSIQQSVLEALAETQQELVAAREQARASTLAKSRFLATVSHEIRTPLNGIIGMTLLALDGELGEEEREFVRLTYESGCALLQIINDILDISKIESGKMSLEVSSFDLKRTVAAALAPLAVTAMELKLSLVAAIDARLPRFVRGDGLRLRQVITNLVGNAIKFTSKGEVVLHMEPAPDEGPDKVHFWVKDDGIGIPPDRLNIIFDRFSQADESTTRRFGGTGLGLAICRELSELMGGRIWAESEEGSGSTFHVVVDLPAAEGEVAAEFRPDVLAGHRTLVAAPSDALRAFIKQTLEAYGAEVLVAQTHLEIREVLDQARDIGGSLHSVIVDTGTCTPEIESLDLISMDAFKDQPMRVIELPPLGAVRRARPSFECEKMPGPVYGPDIVEAMRRGATGELDRPKQHPQGPLLRAEKGMTILVAEDNIVNQKIVCRMLERAGHSVSVVPDGQEALAALEDAHFDLVLMDLHMPVMDGLTAVQKIRSEEAVHGWDRRPVVALTAAAGQGEDDKIADAGFDAVLGKPVVPEALQGVLAMAGDMQKQTDRDRGLSA